MLSWSGPPGSPSLQFLVATSLLGPGSTVVIAPGGTATVVFGPAGVPGPSVMPAVPAVTSPAPAIPPTVANATGAAAQRYTNAPGALGVPGAVPAFGPAVEFTVPLQPPFQPRPASPPVAVSGGSSAGLLFVALLPSPGAPPGVYVFGLAG